MKLARLALASVLFLVGLPLAAQQLEIHYINVGWGGSVLVKGPNGTTVLLEAGNTGKGTQYVVPYLQSIGIQPATGLDYMIGGHQHCDHIGGLDEVIAAGYNVRIKQYSNGSSYASSCVDGWNAAAATTTAGAPVAMPVGTVIQLGNGAKLTCVARNGQIIGGGTVSVSDENDRSMAVLVQYGGFDWIWASDLGGGSDACTGRSTGQLNVESSVINAISPGGLFPLISTQGIDVLHVNHHGSESSTNPDWFNKSNPAVAVIGVGDGQTSGWDLPRIDVVEHVLLAQSASCITSPPTLALQTQEGAPAGSLTSQAGYCVGNIKITTDGLNLFTVSADGAVHSGPNEVAAAVLPRSFTFDDGPPPPPDTTPPTTAITAPADAATVSGTTLVTASASDNVGVTKVEFYLDSALQSTDTTSPYSWSWDTATAVNGSHVLASKAYDAANNVGTSANVNVTVNNASDFSLAVSPASVTVNPGSAASYTVNITRTNFTGSVSFSISGLPAGAAGTFNPNPTTANSSALSITTTTSTPVGSYVFTVTGVSGALTHTATATLVVQAAPSGNFTLSITPSSRNVSSTGGTATYTVNITRTSFTSAVALSISGLPAGTTGSFNPNNTTGNSSTLTLTVASSTAAGSYVFTATGTGGSLTRTATATLVKNPAGGCQGNCQ